MFNSFCSQDFTVCAQKEIDFQRYAYTGKYSLE